MNETKEVKEEVKEEVVVPELSEVEVEVMDQGWLPKEQWVESGRDPNDWRTAKEFKERGEFFKTIHQLKRENRQNTVALDSMKKHHQFVFDQAHRRALADLRKERRQALQSEDVARVEEIETELETLQEEHLTQKTQMEKDQQAAQSAGPTPELTAWIARNPWYELDADLRDEADATGIVYAGRNPGSKPEVVLKHVEDVLRKRFPEKFGIKRGAPNAVTSVDRTKSSRKSEPSYDLNEMETKIMNDLVRAGVMTKEAYIADLKKVKGE